MEKTKPTARKRISIEPNGPLNVRGGIPLVVKTQVVSEHGEPLTWRRIRSLKTPDEYCLCRCGGSDEKPFCDGTHRYNGFDGTETAQTGPAAGRELVFPRGTRIVIKKDPTLCMNSGFCSFHDRSMMTLVGDSADTKVRSLLIAMVERCPSGSLTYRIEPGDEPVEPDLPVQIADTIEVTADGPLSGPLWVTGGVEIERSDGKAFETRNRVTLCNCGESRNKPLCDGTHRDAAEREARKRKTPR